MGLVERFRSWVARVFAPAPRCLLCDGIAPAPSTACPDCLLYATESIRAPEGYLDPFDLPPSRLPDPRVAAVSFRSFIEQAFEILDLDLALDTRNLAATIDAGWRLTSIDAVPKQGKTTIACLLAVWEAWRHADVLVLIVRPSREDRDLSERVLNGITRDLGMVGNAHNGSRIRVQSITDLLRGLHPGLIVCDDLEAGLKGEIEYVRTLFASRVLNLAPPNGRVVVIGTRGPEGFGLGQGPGWLRMPAPATGTPRGPELDAALRDAADGPQDAPKAPGGTSGADGLLEATEAALARATDGYDGPEG